MTPPELYTLLIERILRMGENSCLLSQPRQIIF